MLGCSKSCLRYYESEFNLTIPRGEANRRFYTPRELEMFRYIYKLKADGMKNAQIKAVLNSERINERSFEDKIFKPEEVDEEQADPTGLKELISELLREIGELRKVSRYKNTSDLQKENDELKSKLKEKTYELVETREKLNNIKKAGSKKLFKI